MPAKIKVKVLAGRNLPVMDRASDTTDAFVEIKFGGVTHKTDVCRKSLNPHWSNTDWYRFEVDDSELQDEPLQLRVMDHDTYSANDAIGKVVVSLAPLLAREHSTTGGAVMAGWVPVYDTLHGIRGELNIIVKVDLFSDFNKFRTSSCGVQFFHCPRVPPDYNVTAIHGFVEELIVNDDPEYQWIDKIRTPRASNEARQVAFIKLSNQVQRRVGLKASELGANAVIGYAQSLDLEGETGVVARAAGTAVSLTHRRRLTTHGPSHAQMKKYLEMLGLNEETDVNTYFKSHQDELCSLLDVMHPKSSSDFLDDEVTEESPITDSTAQSFAKMYVDSLSTNRHDLVSQNTIEDLVEDELYVQQLINTQNKEEPSGALHRIKSLKKTFLHKRLSSITSFNRGDKLNDDTVSIKSNSSENSRISMSDLRAEFRKLKKLRKPKFRILSAETDKGTGMASILARSVMQAHTSLACINENLEKENSPSNTMRRSSESEPQLVHIEEQVIPDTETSKATLEQRQTHSVQDQSTLKLPGELGYYGSTSSALSADSSEPYTTSEDDESSDPKTDERAFETVKSIVEAVLQNSINKDEPGKDLNDNVLQRNISQPSEKENTDNAGGGKREDRKDEVVENVSQPIKSEKNADIFGKIADKPQQSLPPRSKKSKSISVPSSPVDRSSSFVSLSSSRIKKHLSKISKTKIIKSVSQIALRKKHDKEFYSSGSDVKSLSPERDTVLGSPFMSYADLMSLVQNKTPEQESVPVQSTGKPVEMFIGSEPPSRASMSDPSSPRRPSKELNDSNNSALNKHGLVMTAMETMLMDKMNSLMFSPPLPKTETNFMQEVNEKLGELSKEQSEPVGVEPMQECVKDSDSQSLMSRNSSTPLLMHLHPIRANNFLETAAAGGSKDLPADVNANDPVDVCDNKHGVLLSNIGRLDELNGASPLDHETNVEGSGAQSTHNAHAGRRTSDSDLNITPKASSVVTNPNLSNISSGGGAILKPSMNANNLEMLEYPFLTMTEFPPGFILHLGGTVCARSVKLVDGGEAGSRASWWAELRTELRAHARALRCTAVLGYNEQTTICEDVCVLSASGTAAVINLDPSILINEEDKEDEENNTLRRDSFGSEGTPKDCSVAHVPYSAASMPYVAELAACAICGKGRVPAVLVTTVEPPSTLKCVGSSCLVWCASSRIRRAAANAPEPAARDVSDQLPFLEYDLHRLLIAKLRMQGANALFGLRTTVSIGERSIVAIAAGTAGFISALPSPKEPTLKAHTDSGELNQLRQALKDALAVNRSRNGYICNEAAPKRVILDDGSCPALELCADKDACVLELDEAEEQETARGLATLPQSTHMATTQRLHGVKLRADKHPAYFVQVWRGKCGSAGAGAALYRTLSAVKYKLRRMAPAALAGLRFHLDLPEDGGASDELQLSVSGVALPLDNTNSEEVFHLDEESTHAANFDGIVVTPLGSVWGGRESRRVCALRLLFVRESTCVRECGGLGGFMHNFLTEAMAVVRAHTRALGGNALTSCTKDELMLQDNPHKNQAQCLLSIGGDVIHVTY